MLTPRDILRTEFGRGWRGYRTHQVDSFLRRVMTEYEALAQENEALKRRIGEEEADQAAAQTRASLRKEIAAGQEKLQALQAEAAAGQERLQRLRQEETAICGRLAQLLQQYRVVLEQGQSATSRFESMLQGWQEAAAAEDRHSGQP